MVKKDLDKIVTVDKIVDTLMKDAEDSGYLKPPENEMVYKVPPYNDELDTAEADDSYNPTRFRLYKEKRFKGVSYRSSRLESDNLSNDSSYIKKLQKIKNLQQKFDESANLSADSSDIKNKFNEVNRNVSEVSEKYYVIFREDFDTLTQAIYVEADSPYDAITEARLVEWLSFKGNTESTFNPALEFDLIAVLKGWPEDVTPLDFTYSV